MTSPIPPHHADAEEAVLGACLVEPGLVADVARRLQPEDFYLERHRAIYRACLRLHDAGLGVDLLTVRVELERAEDLAAVGGPATLARLETCAMVATLVPQYVAVILQASGKRQAIQALTAALEHAHNGTGVQQLALEVGDALGQISERTHPDLLSRPAERLSDLAERYVGELATTLPSFVATGVTGLDRLLGGGWLPGELAYLGAGPGTGKTAIALEWAAFVAAQGQPVLLVSAEMTREGIMRRILAQRSMVGAGGFRAGDLQPDEWDRVRRTLPTFAEWPLIVDDTATSLPAIRRLVHRHHPALVIVDYLQLLEGPKARAGQEEKRHEVSALSRGLKRIAKRHHCVVLALSQLTMTPDGKGWFQRPTAMSLRESRDPTADADTVLLLYRPARDAADVELIVGKGRDHATGTVALHFTPAYLWFRESSEEGSLP